MYYLQNSTLFWLLLPLLTAQILFKKLRINLNVSCMINICTSYFKFICYVPAVFVQGPSLYLTVKFYTVYKQYATGEIVSNNHPLTQVTTMRASMRISRSCIRVLELKERTPSSSSLTLRLSLRNSLRISTTS